MAATVITGGAGYIGSHLADALAEGNQITVIDNLSASGTEFITQHEGKKNFKLLKADLADERECFGTFANAINADTVFHMAADKDVRGGELGVASFQRNNLVATINTLEACRKNDIGNFVFASTSAVYGNATAMPTPEGYGPLLPISHYGASKLACEAYVSSFADNYGMAACVLRFSNVIGTDRARHGIIPDLIAKLRKNPNEVEVLGDGKQSKNYLHVHDCVNGIIAASKKIRPGTCEPYNIASQGRTSVAEIARIIIETAGTGRAKIKYTGKSWAGDVRKFELDAGKLRKAGWKPRFNSIGAVRRAVAEAG